MTPNRAVSNQSNNPRYASTRYESEQEKPLRNPDRLSKRWVKKTSLDEYAPFARTSWPRLAKNLGHKADKQNVAWRKAVKLENLMFPNGYRGSKKTFKPNYELDSDDSDFLDESFSYFHMYESSHIEVPHWLELQHF